MLRRFDRRRLSGGGGIFFFASDQDDTSTARQTPDRVADLHERHRLVEPDLYGLDLGVVTIDGDEVEVALVSPSTIRSLLGPNAPQSVGMVERGEVCSW